MLLLLLLFFIQFIVIIVNTWPVFSFWFVGGGGILAINRVGRVARAGAQGTSYTLLKASEVVTFNDFTFFCCLLL